MIPTLMAFNSSVVSASIFFLIIKAVGAYFSRNVSAVIRTDDPGAQLIAALAAGFTMMPVPFFVEKLTSRVMPQRRVVESRISFFIILNYTVPYFTWRP